MALDTNALLKHGQDLVAHFITQFYPEESVYVMPLWKRYTEHFGDEEPAGTSRMETEYAESVRGLCFVENRRLNLIAPFAIVTVAAVLQEMNMEIAVPPVATVRLAVRRCAEVFGAPRKLIDQMEHNIATSLHEVFQQASPQGAAESKNVEQEYRQTACINISKPTTVDGKTVMTMSRQVTVLLHEFLRRRRLHWARGFVLFERWSRFPPPKPKRMFQNIVAKLSMALKTEGIRLKIEAEKEMGQNTGGWQLIVPKDVTVAGDVEEARMCYEQAKDFLEAGNINRSAEALQKAIARDPHSIASAVLLSRLLTDCTPAEFFDGELLRKAWVTLRQAETGLRDAVLIITKKGEEAERQGDWRSVPETVMEFEGELQEVSQARIVVNRIVQNRAIPSSDDMELCRITEMVKRIKAKQDISDLSIFVQENDSIASICRIVHEKLMCIFREAGFSEDCVVDGVVLRVLCEDICGGGTNPELYASLNDLRKHWISALSIRCAEEIMETEYQITKAEQRFLRERASANKRCPQRPEDTEIAKKMAGLCGRVNLDAYWGLFRKTSAKRRPYREDTKADGGS